MEKILGVHVVVEGKVQGVGYRAFTEVQAVQKKLHGWVRNRRDGTVEVEAEGSGSEIEAFLCALESGPALARVSKITVDWTEINRHTQGFTVRRD